MQPYQYSFIDFLINQNALLFGSFTLKSGRVSPYFFNAGQFNNAYALSKLGKYYAAALKDANIECDVLFAPAYKGIPIVSSVAIALYEDYQINLPFCFNRKEKKAYGEGGDLIGAPLTGRVVLVDDVISAGTTFKESAALISDHKAELVAVITALDREERGEGKFSAIEEIERHFNVRAINIVKLQDVIEYLQDKPNYAQQVADILSYQEKYGVKNL